MKGKNNMVQKIFKAIPRRLSLKLRIRLTNIFIAIAGCYYAFFYSPYLQKLSSSEEKLLYLVIFLSFSYVKMECLIGMHQDPFIKKLRYFVSFN